MKNNWNLGQDKAPGLDDFLLFFYHFFWNDIKLDLVKLMEELFNGNIRLDRINYSNVILIPKKESPFRIEEFRPISLLNSSL